MPDGTEISTLKSLIDWAMRYGAAWAAFKLIDRIAKPAMEYDTKVYLSWGVACALALVAWGFGILMTYIPIPGDGWRAWVEGGAGIVLTVILLNRGIYATAKAKERRVQAAKVSQ